MSLEKQIKAMLESQQARLAEKATLPGSKDTGDKAPPKQGSSEDAPTTELEMGDKGNQGASAAAAIPAAGDAASIVPKGDAKTVKVQSMESVEPADLKADIAALFEGQELAEEFVAKATSIFEAAVIARVNAEVVKAATKLEEQAATELAELKNTLSEQVDQYMSYVVENWMKENQVAIDQGLRTEVAEGFITGLKTLFQENYIEVPEDKVDVLETLSTDLDETKSRLNEEIEKTIALNKQIADLEKAAVLESASKGMTATDAERLTKLVEGVDFENKEAFAAKIAVIKESHFKKAAVKSAEQILAESTGEGASEKVVSDTVQRYVNAISRNSKFSQ
jgi:hypothetical protein